MEGDGGGEGGIERKRERRESDLFLSLSMCTAEEGEGGWRKGSRRG